MTTQSDGTFHWGQIFPLAKQLEADLVPSSPAYARFVALRWVAKDAIESNPSRYWQALRLAIIDVLEGHLDSIRGDTSAISLPDDVAQYLLEGLLDLADGHKNSVLMPMKMPGGKGNIRKRSTQRQIDKAIEYLTAVDMGLVEDKHSRETVAKSFGVNRRQVSRWLSTTGPFEARQRRMQDRWKNVIKYQHKAATAKFFTAMMEFAAQDYSKARQR